MLPLGVLIRSFNQVSYHFYADDTQLYFSFKSSDLNKLSILKDCLSSIKDWMSQNFLQLNPDKTEILIVGPENTRTEIQHFMGSASANFTNFTSSSKNLGVLFDHKMNFEAHVKKVVQTCYFQLRNISQIKALLSKNDLEKLIHAFISSRLDYCNSLFSTLNHCSLHRLQLVQNAAARLLTNTHRWSHITPVLKALHWLPVESRIVFKIILITFKALHGQAPKYLSDLLHPKTNVRVLRSSNKRLLDVPKTKLKSKGDRAFEKIAPTLWNELPFSLKTVDSVEIFKGLLKTHLFRKHYG